MVGFAFFFIYPFWGSGIYNGVFVGYFLFSPSRVFSSTGFMSSHIVFTHFPMSEPYTIGVVTAVLHKMFEYCSW